MIVIPNSSFGQARPLRGVCCSLLPMLSVSLCALLSAASVSQAESFSNLQAVDANGVSAWNGSFPITLVGVLLTDPDEMLDSTPQFVPWNSGAGMYQMGGQWQVFAQAVASGDRGGVECWMGQNYGNLPWNAHDGSDSYTDAAWVSEMNRVSVDAATGRVFRKGDLVMITANGSLFYGGQRNINEQHSIDASLDFSISLISSNFGLPTAEVISLSSVVTNVANASGHFDLFDATRATGGEHYQGMRVRINGLTLVNTNGWNTNADWDSRYCSVTNSEGLSFSLIHPLYDIGPAPTNAFDAVGVFMQESGSGSDGTFGYELFVQEAYPTDAAELTIVNKPVISWPGSLSNYRLESADSLTTPNWKVVTNAPALINGQNTVIIDPAAGQKYYRLQQAQ
jgi:hypothetical protein